MQFSLPLSHLNKNWFKSIFNVVCFASFAPQAVSFFQLLKERILSCCQSIFCLFLISDFFSSESLVHMFVIFMLFLNYCLVKQVMLLKGVTPIGKPSGSPVGDHWYPHWENRVPIEIQVYPKWDGLVDNMLLPKISSLIQYAVRNVSQLLSALLYCLMLALSRVIVTQTTSIGIYLYPDWNPFLPMRISMDPVGSHRVIVTQTTSIGIYLYPDWNPILPMRISMDPDWESQGHWQPNYSIGIYICPDWNPILPLRISMDPNRETLGWHWQPNYLNWDIPLSRLKPYSPNEDINGPQSGNPWLTLTTIYLNWDILVSRLELYSPNEDITGPQSGKPLGDKEQMIVDWSFLNGRVVSLYSMHSPQVLHASIVYKTIRSVVRRLLELEFSVLCFNNSLTIFLARLQLAFHLVF